MWSLKERNCVLGDCDQKLEFWTHLCQELWDSRQFTSLFCTCLFSLRRWGGYFNCITLSMEVWRGQTQINREKPDFSCFVTHFSMGEHSTAHRAAQEKHGAGRGWNCGQATPLCFVWEQKCEEGEAGLGMANWNISSCFWGLGCLWFSGIWSWDN